MFRQRDSSRSRKTTRTRKSRRTSASRNSSPSRKAVTRNISCSMSGWCFYWKRSAHISSRVGWDAGDIFVMSGYRTPYYNKQLDDTKYSLHQWGRAADIFLDKDDNGRMDDFNKDNVDLEGGRGRARRCARSARQDRRAQARSSAASAFTDSPPLTDPSCTWTRAPGGPGGDLLVVFFDVFLFLRLPLP